MGWEGKWGTGGKRTPLGDWVSRSSSSVGPPSSTRPSPALCSRDIQLPLPTGLPRPDGRAVHRPALASISREGCRGPGCTEMFRQSASGRGGGHQDLWRLVRRRLARCWPSGGVRTESVKGEGQGEGREAGGATSHRALQTAVRARDGPLVTRSHCLLLSSRGGHVRMWREGT